MTADGRPAQYPCPPCPGSGARRGWPRARSSAPPEPRLAEVTAHGLTWVHLDAPPADEAAELAERFGWHELDLEDVLSKRQRPKIDEYPDYLFSVLHFPVTTRPSGA